MSKVWRDIPWCKAERKSQQWLLFFVLFTILAKVYILYFPRKKKKQPYIDSRKCWHYTWKHFDEGYCTSSLTIDPSLSTSFLALAVIYERLLFSLEVFCLGLSSGFSLSWLTVIKLGHLPFCVVLSAGCFTASPATDSRTNAALPLTQTTSDGFFLSF